MSTDSEFNWIAKAWLADGPDELSVRVLDAVVDDIHVTRQRRASGVSWRFQTMTTSARVATAAAVIIGVLVVGGSFLVFGKPGQSAVGGPTTSPSASTPGAGSPSPAAFRPALTQTYASARNGFAVAYPVSWTTTPATESWMPGLALGSRDPAQDVIGAADVRLAVASQRLDAAQTPDAWYLATCRLVLATSDCSRPMDTRQKVQIYGATGYLDAASGGQPSANVVADGVALGAVVVSGDRGYRIVLDGHVDRALFDAILGTVRFSPADAIDLPPLTRTFASPTYGYSIGLPNGWTVTPATSRWAGIESDDILQKLTRSPTDKPAMDMITAIGTDTTLPSASQLLASGMTIDTWLDSFFRSTVAQGYPCTGSDPSEWPTVQIGPQTGRLWLGCDEAAAFIAVAGRVYVFGWSNVSSNGPTHLTQASWIRLLKSVTFDAATAR